ncbi:hypothetical protein [Anaeromicropila herbilytica]|uniref:Uncharacterized protein n=1 Tax=Anaeromicropila herbilytica TaxID=2785025 RepID=A0A7R7IDM0_9FIRM|nr:hypothetical protein [Anaeromicropila herbilytica]BCN31687.1 hypothetical protein bsdtb5_29820 [Anaeromicropila herbilytica]
MNKEIIQIIIVEDDKNIRDMYETCIEEFNIDNSEYEIKSFLLVNDDEVPKILYNHHIDAMVVDLDWGTGSKQNEGNRLVKKIHRDCRVPIFIVSGNLQFLEEEYDESPILKKYQRDEVDVNELLDEITSLYKTGYTNVLGNYSEIDNMLSKVFWNHMSDVISSWKDQERDFQTQRMLRFAITRINEMLTINANDNHDDFDALEFYIKPAIKVTPFSGDIVSYDNKKYVVITAACDMEQDNSDFVVLCYIDFSMLDKITKRIKSGSNSAEKDLEKYINNAKSRYHLLPPCQLFIGGLVDFQLIRSVEKKDFLDGVSVIASINPVFHKDIQARFSHYYGRQGQPQLNKDNIIDWIRTN